MVIQRIFTGPQKLLKAVQCQFFYKLIKSLQNYLNKLTQNALIKMYRTNICPYMFFKVGILALIIGIFLVCIGNCYLQTSPFKTIPNSKYCLNRQLDPKCRTRTHIVDMVDEFETSLNEFYMQSQIIRVPKSSKLLDKSLLSLKKVHQMHLFLCCQVE